MASIFSRIVAGEIPCYKVAEDDNYFAFLDISPMVKGHTLVIPKREVDYIFDLEDDELAGLHLFAKKVAKALKTDTVQVLTKVELKNVKTGMKMCYAIVPESEANLKAGKISVSTPIAQGLLGKKPGDIADIKTPGGMISLEIISISIA